MSFAITPIISVVLPVFNVAPHIEETIASLLSQTFSDFELLVLDDCSTDDTAARVKQIQDPRLRFIQNERNLGRAGTDNAALPHIRGEFVAKMDGDDICHPERLARQLAFLRANPAVNVVGSWMQNFGASTYLNRYPSQPEAAQVLTLFTLPVGNPSVMLRASLLQEQGLSYDAALRQTEDYDFFARYIQQLRVVTLPEVLIHYRVPPQTSKATILLERTNAADSVRAQLLRAWGIPHTERELRLHNTIAMLDRPLGDLTLVEAEAWLQKLIAYNDEHPLFDSGALRQGLGERWFEVCYAHPQPWLGAARAFGRSSLAGYFSVTTQRRFRLWAKAARKFIG